LAPALRAARDAAVRVVGDLAAGDARAGRVRVPARDARGVLAFRESVRPVHGERRLHAGREGHDLAVRGDPRELHARTAGSAAVGVAAARPEAVRRGVRRAALLPGRAVQLVGVRDRFADDDRRALADRRRGAAGGGGRGRRRGGGRGRRRGGGRGRRRGGGRGRRRDGGRGRRRSGGRGRRRNGARRGRRRLRGGRRARRGGRGRRRN